MAIEGQTLLPGDWVAVPQSCRLGPGLYNEPSDSSEPGEDSDVRACMAGVLRKRETSRAVGGGRSSSEDGGGGSTLKMAWVDYSSKRVRELEVSSTDFELYALTMQIQNGITVQLLYKDTPEN